MLKNLIRIAFLGPQGVQDSAKLGPSWAKLGPSWAKLGPSWAQVGILRRCCRHLAVILASWPVLEATWRQLGRTYAVLEPFGGHLGRQEANSSARVGPA